jgi:hypothetical protein
MNTDTALQPTKICVNGPLAADKLMFLILSVVRTAVTVSEGFLSEYRRFLYQYLYGVGWRTLGSLAHTSKETTKALRLYIPLQRDEIGNFLEPQLRRLGTDPRTVWFRQGGATSRTAPASMNVLKRNAASTRYQYFSER